MPDKPRTPELMPHEKFVDVYREQELRSIYRGMFPGCNFDDDCFFVFIRVGEHGFLVDASMSLAMRDPEAEHMPFYSEKGEKRVRAAQAVCKFRKREYVGGEEKIPPVESPYPIFIGVTSGPKIKEG
jgi:hypothetical protein